MKLVIFDSKIFMRENNSAFVPSFFILIEEQKQCNETQYWIRHCLQQGVWAQGNIDTDMFLERELIDY